MGYWGCGTKNNKIAWTVFVAFMGFGVTLIIAGSAGASANKSCFQKYFECMDKTNDQQACLDHANRLCNLRRWLGLTGTGILSIICGFLSTTYFCCCARPPRMQLEGAVSLVQQGGYYTSAPVGYPLEQPYPMQQGPPQAVIGYPAASPVGYPAASPVGYPAASPVGYPPPPPEQSGGYPAYPSLYGQQHHQGAGAWAREAPAAAPLSPATSATPPPAGYPGPK